MKFHQLHRGVKRSEKAKVEKDSRMLYRTIRSRNEEDKRLCEVFRLNFHGESLVFDS